MSLLMDALKKAEREKSRASSADGNTASFTEQTDNLDEYSVRTEPKITQLPDLETTEDFLATAELTNTELADPKDESWAFDSGELELEPISKRLSDSLEEIRNEKKLLDEDTTLIEPLPLDRGFPEPDITVQSEVESHKSDFDHDVTLPSERAIQSSLKDYFEASQSITLDQNSVNAVADQTEHSITSTSPLDTSATHVTAHTIFTAGQTRPMSTGLGKYAMFGTLALGIGLGSVALYYSYVTPKVISMPTDMASVADMVEPQIKQVTPAEKVNSSLPVISSPITSPAKEPIIATMEVEDAVLAEVVEELPAIKTSSAPTDITQNPESVFSREQSAPKTSTEVVIQSPVEKIEPTAIETSPVQTFTHKEEPVIFQPEKVIAAIEPTPKPRIQPEIKASTNDTVYYSPEYQSPKVAEPEEAIIRNDQKYQSDVLRGGYSLNKPVVKSEQPIEVMSAQDFSKGLNVPQSAIKITKGHSHRASRSDLETAYRAYQSGDFITAKSAYRRVLNRRPDSRDARLGVAAIAVMEGNHEKAYRNYHYLLQQNPQDQVVNAALFNLQGNTSGHANESQLKMSLDKNPSSPQVHFSLGSFYAGQARWPEAQQSFFDAFSADKNNGDYAYNLAVSLDQMGQAKPALSYYRTALKLADNRQVGFNTSKVLARIQKLSGIVKN